ncbi:hypothetical protein FB451DRAFT_1413545 [Mycena latifolia]|nr:hypothetical protein FB451DRAFT_1413545 [Mycena latifolia]
MPASEVQNLRAILCACYASLESLSLPGELASLSVDSSLTWNSLRELYIEGSGRSALSRNISQRVLPDDVGSMTASNVFLPRLQKFELASLQAGERILSVLPPGLEELALLEYPTPLRRQPRNIPSAAEFIGIVAGVYLPAVARLELWYRTDGSEDRFLRSLPAASGTPPIYR